MGYNLIVYALTALVPLVLGFIWYNPKVLGTPWMQSAGMTEDTMKGANMALIFGLTYVFSFFLAVGIGFATIHQFALYSFVADIPEAHDPSTPVGQWFASTFSAFGNSYRTYKHGAFHGFSAGLTFALPFLAINALFERKGFKYIAINVGYWLLCTTIMGAIVCHWLQVGPHSM